MALLLLIYSLLLFPLFVRVLRLIFVLLFSTFCNHLDGEAGAGCFALTVFLMYRDSQCSVAFPRRAMGCSAVRNCGISSLYSLVFDKKLNKK